MTREETLELIDALLARARAVQSRLDELRSSREAHISVAADAVINHVDSLAQGIIADLTERRVASEQERLIDDSRGWDRIQRRVRRYAQVLWVLHILLGFVVHSTREQVAEAVALMLEAVSVRWFADEAKLTLVQSEWDLNFLYCPISELMPGASVDIAVLSFPTLERSDFLLNCILLHELGHQVDDARRWSGQTTPDTNSQEWQGAIGEGIPQDRLLQIANDWLREIASDLAACAALGPAYFFAFAEFSLMFGAIDDASDSHPPGRTRLEVMLSFLHDVFGEHLAPFEVHLLSWENRLRDREPTYALSAELAAVSASLAAGALGQLAQRIASTARRACYDGNALASVVPSMAEELAELIPPGQYEGATCDVVSVANSAWLCYLEHRDRIAELIGLRGEDQQRNVVVREKICDLAMAAIEHIYVRTVWELATDGGSQQG